MTAQRMYCTTMKTDLSSKFNSTKHYQITALSPYGMLFIIVVGTVSKCVGHVYTFNHTLTLAVCG